MWFKILQKTNLYFIDKTLASLFNQKQEDIQEWLKLTQWSDRDGRTIEDFLLTFISRACYENK